MHVCVHFMVSAALALQEVAASRHRIVAAGMVAAGMVAGHGTAAGLYMLDFA